MRIDLSAFQARFQQSVRDVLPFFSKDELRLIARHNPAWGPGRFDLAGYLGASQIRYAQALQLFNAARPAGPAPETTSVLDVGGFMAVFPLTLARCGVSVTLAEKYGYYAGAFDRLAEFLQAEGVAIVDEDFSDSEVDIGARFDLVTNMAVLEHLASSPKQMLANLKQHMKPDGRLLLEVPNLAYWPKRIQLLRGHTIHPDIQTVFDAEIPFIGHHREYTMNDLRVLAQLGGFRLDDLVSFNYTPWLDRSLKQRLFLIWPTRVFPSCREVLMAVLRQA